MGEECKTAGEVQNRKSHAAFHTIPDKNKSHTGFLPMPLPSRSFTNPKTAVNAETANGMRSPVSGTQGTAAGSREHNGLLFIFRPLAMAIRAALVLLEQAVRLVAQEAAALRIGAHVLFL